MKSRSREIGSLNYRIALKFDWHIGSSAADVPIKFQSDRAILNIKLVAHSKTSYRILKRGPDLQLDAVT